MAEQRIMVDIAELYLYTNNPRFEDIADNQRDAILKLVEHHPDKIVKLASDIAENGLSFLETIAIKKNDQQYYIVREGNRRITAIKLLSQPSIVEGLKNTYDKFKQLNKKFVKNPITSIECVLFDDENKLNRWIELRHAGENGGVGLTTWTAMQKRRFDESLGNRSLAIDAVDFIMKSDRIEQNLKDNLHKISITNLERLFGDPYVKSELGIFYKQGEPFIVDTENIKTFTLFRYVMNDIIFNSKFKVALIYNKDNRKDYISSAKTKVLGKSNTNTNTNTNTNSKTGSGDSSTNTESNVNDANNSGAKSTTPNNNSSGSGASANRNQTKANVKPVPLSTSRKVLIPSSYKLSVKHHRLNIIYNELKSLNVDEYPNAVAVLFRTFVELSFDHYANIKKVNNYF